MVFKEFHCKRCKRMWRTPVEAPKKCAWCRSVLWDKDYERAPGAGRPKKVIEGNEEHPAVYREETGKLVAGKRYNEERSQGSPGIEMSYEAEVMSAEPESNRAAVRAQVRPIVKAKRRQREPPEDSA